MLQELPIYRQSNHPMARNRQKPFWQQVFLALSVLGCEGNGASNFRIGRLFGDIGQTQLLNINSNLLRLLEAFVMNGFILLQYKMKNFFYYNLK